MKRGIILGDSHCGHLVGLTPPGWWSPDNRRHRRFRKVQQEMWDWYIASLAQLPPLDFVFWNGDLIDGSGRRSGGTECITTDLSDQRDMAIEVVAKSFRGRGPKKKDPALMVHTFGTAYHVSEGEDHERAIADVFGAKIGSHEWVQVEGVTFDLKHHVCSSSVPHGRATAIKRDALWSDIWAEADRTPRADVLIRSHVHYHEYSGNPRKLAMTLPALQGYATKYGARRCSGIVDIGMTYWEISGDTYSWRPILLEPTSLKVTPVRLK